MIKKIDIPDDIYQEVLDGCAEAYQRPEFIKENGQQIPNTESKELFFEKILIKAIKEIHKVGEIKTRINAARDAGIEASIKATKDIKIVEDVG